MNKLQIPAIESHSDTLYLFPFGMNGHYNEEGYRMVSKVIINGIN